MTGLPTVEAIDRALPQTQCTRCGYADCAAYATAIAKDAAPVDRCPPGGDATLTALVRITGRVADRVDPRCGAFDALETSDRLALAGPAATGENTTDTVQVAPGASAPPQVVDGAYNAASGPEAVSAPTFTAPLPVFVTTTTSGPLEMPTVWGPKVSPFG